MTDTTSAAPSLLPCPFCGAGETHIHVNKGVWNGHSYGDPVSVEVRHWCPTTDGQLSRMLVAAGRDEASAIAAWNRRAQPVAREPMEADVSAVNGINARIHFRRGWRAAEVAHGIGTEKGDSHA